MTSKPHDFHFLVDVNLPKHFSYFNSEAFQHVVDIDPQMKDQDIWRFALENEYVIITRDADFYHWYTASENFPKTVYLKLGNITLNELHQFFENHWTFITQQLEHASLILVEKTKITTLF